MKNRKFLTGFPLAIRCDNFCIQDPAPCCLHPGKNNSGKLHLLPGDVQRAVSHYAHPLHFGTSRFYLPISPGSYSCEQQYHKPGQHLYRFHINAARNQV
jgi:hypothetical protein